MDKILKYKKVKFKINNKIYKVKTNKKGIATLTLKNLNVGKYKIYSSFIFCSPLINTYNVFIFML